MDLDKQLDTVLTVLATLVAGWIGRIIAKRWRILQEEFRKLRQDVAGAEQTESRLASQDDRIGALESHYDNLLIALRAKNMLTHEDLRIHGALRDHHHPPTIQPALPSPNQQTSAREPQ